MNSISNENLSCIRGILKFIEDDRIQRFRIENEKDIDTNLDNENVISTNLDNEKPYINKLHKKQF